MSASVQPESGGRLALVAYPKLPRQSQDDSPAGLPPAPQVQFATAGDHPSIHHFLLSMFQQPSAEEFHAQQEAPSYEPADRLVVKRGQQIIAHARLANYEMHFGPLSLPVTSISEVATLPEYRKQGCATVLLAAAERKMVDEGAVLGLLRTNLPHFYRKRGWAVCGRHCYSTAAPRDILSYLSATEASRESLCSPRLYDPEGVFETAPQLNIRLWRHVEQVALTRLYADNTIGVYGPWWRSDDYWRWLISRRGYDRIYIAIEGPDKFDLDESLAPIVGYAAMKEGRIVELMTSPKQSRIAAALLARACSDAIERDYHNVRLDAPPDDPLHQTIALAGGKHCCHESENGHVFMVKMLDPLAFLKALCPQLHERAKAADLPRPCELGLLYKGAKYGLMVSRRSVKLRPGKLGRSYITCNAAQLTQLLLGHLKVKDAVEAGRLEVSTRVAEETASVLFPRLPLWRPPLDDLPA